MTLNHKKVYDDVRFKTLDSLSDSNFWIELPRSLNVTDDCVCYIDDIVIPVSWSTVDSRDNQLDIDIEITENFHRYHVLTMPSQNFVGATLAAVLQTALDEAVADELLNFQVSYDLNDNLINIKLIDHEDGLYVRFVSDVDLIAGVHWNERLLKDRINSLNGVLRVDKTTTLSARESNYTAYIDLHTTRNLDLTSSSSASCNIIYNFGSDVIIKNNQCRLTMERCCLTVWKLALLI
jgi:hypothetical protein